MVNKIYRYSDTIIIRNPIYKIGECLDVGSIKLLIKAKMDDVFFRNAILLSSISFFEQLEAYCQLESMSTRQQHKIELTFIKYLNRMSTRCTPFGLFSTLSTTSVSGEYISDQINLEDEKLSIRLHMALLENIAEAVTTNYADMIKFSVNSTLFIYESGYTYIKHKNIENRRIHETIEVDDNPYIEVLFKECQRDFTIKELTKLFHHVDPSVSMEILSDFIYDLINLKILISELDIIVTSDSYQNRLNTFIDSLLSINCGDKKLLHSAKKIFSIIDSLNIYDDFKNARKTIIEILDEVDVKYHPNNILHANLYRSQGIAPVVDKHVIADVVKGLDVLCHYSLNRENENLAAFKKEFIEIYGSSLVPLTQVMSTTIGLGYPLNKSKIDDTNQLLQELTPPQKKKAEWTKQDYNTVNHKFWLNKYVECLLNGKDQISLTNSDLTGFNNKANELPDTFSCSFSLVPNRCSEVKGNKKYAIKYNGWGGSSAINFLARFASGNTNISDVCREASAVEEQLSADDEIVAEICHIADSRVGDVLGHTAFRKYEIPYLVNSSVDSEFRIKISDIQIGVFDNEFVLFSSKHKKKIKPLLSNAHNHKLSEHPIYKFLCELQDEKHIAGPYIDFGPWSDEVYFFPRVCYENLVLVACGWVLEKNFFADHLSGKQTVEQLKAKFRELPFSPEKFIVDRGDNELYVNINSDYHWELFMDYCSKQKGGKIIIKEFDAYYDDDFSNEIILSLFKQKR